MENVSNFVSTISPSLQTWRRHLHKHPELGWLEYETTYYIGSILKELGFTLAVGKKALVSEERMGVPSDLTLKMKEATSREKGVPEEWLQLMIGGHTGLVATLDTHKAGKHVALRFDIDALPIEENKDELKEHFPTTQSFSSSNKGVMHACAHDGHTAIGLGVATYLSRHKDKLSGKYTLLFQPAEEGSRGAKAMVAKGWLDEVDVFLSGHIGISPMSVGEVVASAHGFLATSKIDVSFNGSAAHAGVEPQAGKNALLAAASASLHLHAIPRHSDGVTRVNVGTLHAGSGRNVIADHAEMTLETRGETSELNQYMEDEAVRILKSTANLFGVSADIHLVGKGVEAACEPGWRELVVDATHTSTRVKKVHETLPLKASEDVAYMLNHVRRNGAKATYFVFGTPLPSGHHHPLFDFDENVLEVALEVYLSTILAFSS